MTVDVEMSDASAFEDGPGEQSVSEGGHAGEHSRDTAAATTSPSTLLRTLAKNQWFAVGGIGLIVVVAALVIWGVVTGGEAGAGIDRSFDTVEVRRTTLVESEDFNGTLGYRDSVSVGSPTSGTVRGLAEEGSVVGGGTVLATVDTDAVILLDGAEPAWRTLDTSTEGSDVAQLESNLVALGYVSADDLAVDDDFTWATANAVEAMQAALGLEQSGILELGSYVFEAGPQRVSGRLATIGARVNAGAPLISLSSVDREVTVGVPPEDVGLFPVGGQVDVELPDSTVTTGHVTEISQTLSGGDSSTGQGATQTVRVALDDPAAAGDLVSASVTVSGKRTVAGDVVVVPVQALVALAEGGYALEVVDGESTRLVAVDPGTYADGLVAVTGDIEVGAEVLVPA